MTPVGMVILVIDPALRFIHSLSGPAISHEARIFLCAVSGQEAEWTHRYQHSPAEEPGPARGRWQFERGGGVQGVLTHPATAGLARSVCDALEIVATADAVWRALEGNDLLAAAFARLLLYTDPYPIPDNAEDAWICYNERLWRPGKPHPETWQYNWDQAVNAVATVNSHSAQANMLGV